MNHNWPSQLTSITYIIRVSRNDTPNAGGTPSSSPVEAPIGGESGTIRAAWRHMSVLEQ